MKGRKVVDSSADSSVRVIWLVVLLGVAAATVYAAHFILFTPVGR